MRSFVTSIDDKWNNLVQENGDDALSVMQGKWNGFNVNLNAAYDNIEIEKSCIIYLQLSSIQFISSFKFVFLKDWILLSIRVILKHVIKLIINTSLLHFCILSLGSVGFEMLFLYVIDLDNIIKEYIHFTDKELIKMIV